MRADKSERNFTDGSQKEPVYILSKEENHIPEKNNSGEINEPYILLSHNFSTDEMALMYHYKTNRFRNSQPH
jgi:hypothetical protein